MKRFVKRLVCAAAFVVALGGCEQGLLTVEDGDDMDRLAVVIGRDNVSQEQVKYYMMLDRFEKTDPSKVVGRVTCSGDANAGAKWAVTAKMLAAEFVEFMASGPKPPLRQVGLDFMHWLVAKYRDIGCDMEIDEKYWNENHLGEEDDDSFSNRSAAEWLVGLDGDYLRAHPGLMTALGLVLAGSVIVALPVSGIGLALCPMSTSILCPDDPGNPWTSQPGTGGAGDR